MKKIFICLFFVFISFGISDSWRDLNELHKYLKEVGLSAQQEKEIKILFKQYHQNLKEWWHDNEKIDVLTIRLFVKDDFDMKQIEHKVQSIYERKKELDLKFLKVLHSILNKEQREQILKEFGDLD